MVKMITELTVQRKSHRRRRRKNGVVGHLSLSRTRCSDADEESTTRLDTTRQDTTGPSTCRRRRTLLICFPPASADPQYKRLSSAAATACMHVEATSPALVIFPGPFQNVQYTSIYLNGPCCPSVLPTFFRLGYTFSVKIVPQVTYIIMCRVGRTNLLHWRI